MSNTTFMSVDEVAEALGTSVAFGYKVIKQFNNELKAKGYFTVAGKVNRQYFYERICYKSNSAKGDADNANL